MLNNGPSDVFSVNGRSLSLGTEFDLGELNVSPEEIISFAHVVDPLPFHVDEEAARKSHFKTLVASGPMMYSEFHKRAFIPLFGPSIMAGRGILEWMFYKPHFPDRSYFGTLTVLSLEPHLDKGNVTVQWHFLFRDGRGHLAQELKVAIIHRLDP